MEEHRCDNPAQAGPTLPPGGKVPTDGWAAREAEDWSEQQWGERGAAAASRALSVTDDSVAWQLLVRHARAVLRTYSTSFFVVTRFLPKYKRDQVEAIYAAVRYPDEVVDTFDWPTARKHAELDAWEAQYETGIASGSVREAVAAGVSPHLAPFTAVVRQNGIPPEHYRAFLEAMRRDVSPRPFDSLDDLIRSYVYGSAIVVGYFLTYVYGPDKPGDMERALQSARDLGIALQLTNFLRDVREDHRRGRLYMPLDLLRARGVEAPDPSDPAQREAFESVMREVVRVADEHYERASENVDAFARDSRTAIRACERVYRELNARIGASEHAIAHRESVPFRDKFRLLPASKYWRLPWAYLSS
jgi:phytoene synthase